MNNKWTVYLDLNGETLHYKRGNANWGGTILWMYVNSRHTNPIRENQVYCEVTRCFGDGDPERLSENVVFRKLKEEFPTIELRPDLVGVFWAPDVFLTMLKLRSEN